MLRHMNGLLLTEKKMGRNGVHRRDSLYQLTRSVEFERKHPADRRIISPPEIWFNSYWSHSHHKFQHHLRHLGEVGLDKCNTAADENNAVTFKSERRIVLQYLERQYWRILQSSRDIHLCIRKHKRKYGLLDVNREREPSSDLISQGCCASTMEEKIANGCVLLEAYADTFKRDQTFATKATIARMQVEFDECYNAIPREIAIKEVLQAMRNFQDGWNHNTWAGNFITAFDNMEISLRRYKNLEERFSVVIFYRIGIVILIYSWDRPKKTDYIGVSMTRA